MREEYTTDQLVEMPLEKLVDLIQKLSKYHFENSEGILKELRKLFLKPFVVLIV